MASIMEMARETDERRRLPGMFSPDVKVGIDETFIRYDDKPFTDVFRLSVTVSTVFAANPAQKRHAWDNALKMLQHRLYEDVIGHLQEAMSCIYAEQPKEAMDAIQSALKECTGA